MDIIKNNLMSRNMLLTFSFTIALIISGQVTLPFYPVPFTLQTLMLTVAILYKPRIALQSVSLYVLLGIIGLPVFADWSNAAIAINCPSVGYIVGMLVATATINWLNIENPVAKMTIFNVGLFACGVSYLSYLFGLSAALRGGLLIFIAPEVVKTVVAYSIYRYIK